MQVYSSNTSDPEEYVYHFLFISYRQLPQRMQIVESRASLIYPKSETYTDLGCSACPLGLSFIVVISRSVVSDSFATLWTVAHQAPPSTGFPGKNSGVGCHFFFQGIFLDQGSNLCLPHWQVDSLPMSHQGSPSRDILIFWGNLFLCNFKHIENLQE